MGKSLEINVAYQAGTDWGAVTVVELLRPAERLAKAVIAPYPAMTLKGGIWVPDKRGEQRLPDGTRFHRIDWKGVVTGGCPQAERRALQAHGIRAKVITLKDDPEEYYNLLLGRGLLIRR